MEILNAKFDNPDETVVNADVNGRNTAFPAVVGKRIYDEMVAQNITPDPYVAPPPPIPPTNDELYEEVLQNQKVLKAIALVCAEQFGMTPAQMKTAVKAKM